MSLLRDSKAYLKIIGINLTILILFLFSPPLILNFYRSFYPKFVRLFTQNFDERAFYPTYANKKFSIRLFNEFQKTTAFYRSYIGWRRRKVSFKYTNISGPYNARKSKGEAINNSAWFFGGSTMWGTGASDEQTIPSHFSSLTNNAVYNFGEAGWNSRQSVNQLISVIGDGHSPSVVIFYDGVNEVINQCRSEIKLVPAHHREKQIQNALNPPPLKNRISNYILSPYIAVAKKLRIKLPIFNFKEFDCDINQDKALLIAQHLVNNWQTAFSLSKTKGFEFYGILQPTLFTTKTNSEYFASSKVKKNSELQIQYNIVYPLILKEIERYCDFDRDFCLSMINGTDWLDGTNNVFIDWCHVNSLGNKFIAQRLKLLLKI